MIDKEAFFVGKLASKKKFITPSFKGREAAIDSVNNLFPQAEQDFLRAGKVAERVIKHELAHALGDPEVEGHIEITIVVIGITTPKFFLGGHVVSGRYVPEGRERTFDEMKNMAESPSNPSISDKYSVWINSRLKEGFQPKK